MPSVALVVIATGEDYWRYLKPLVESARKYFLRHHVILFTDSPEDHGVAMQIQIEPLGYPQQTLRRYHTILDHEGLFNPYEHVYYVDVDALFVAPVGEEILSDGITATLHAGYVNGGGAWETRLESTAYVQPRQAKQYFAGGFGGGTRAAYLEMARTIRKCVDIDASRRITAVWHDESHLQHYLHFKPPAKILSPAYCYPEPPYFMRPDPAEALRAVEEQRTAGIPERQIWEPERYLPKIVCLEKRWRQAGMPWCAAAVPA